MRAAATLILAGIVLAAAPAWSANKEHRDEEPAPAIDLPRPPPPADEIGVRLTTRPGVTESFLFDLPAAPKATVILFPGGEGVIGIEGEGPHPGVRHWGNFLIRTRDKFLAAGFATVALDVPSDETGGISEGFRKGAEHAADVAAVIAWARQKVKAPVWLVGTSMGTVSAAAVAIRLGSGIDGLVLTSTVTLAGHNSPGFGVATLDLDTIAVPALVMAHVNDGCKVSPPGNADVIARHMTKSPRVAVKMIEGGRDPLSGACEPFAYHGYFGVEDKAVDTIAGFILGR